MSLRQVFKALGFIGWLMERIDKLTQRIIRSIEVRKARLQGRKDAEYDSMRELAEGMRRDHDVDKALGDPDDPWTERMRRKYESEGNNGS